MNILMYIYGESIKIENVISETFVLDCEKSYELQRKLKGDISLPLWNVNE